MAVASPRFLRITCLVFAALAVVICVLGFCDGIAVFHDQHNCSFGGVFVMHERPPCEPEYVLHTIYGVVPNPAALIAFMAALLAPGVLVWKRPRITFALLWSPLAAVTSVFGLMATATGDHSGEYLQVRVLPAFSAFGSLLFVLIVGIVVFLPLACGVLALLQRAPRSASLPDDIEAEVADLVRRARRPR